MNLMIDNALLIASILVFVSLVAASGKPVEWPNLFISISAAGVGFLLRSYRSRLAYLSDPA
jgi:hypothetical protein